MPTQKSNYPYPYLSTQTLKTINVSPNLFQIFPEFNSNSKTCYLDKFILIPLTYQGSNVLQVSTSQTKFTLVATDISLCVGNFTSLHARQTAASAKELEQYCNEAQIWLELLEEEAKQGEGLKEEDFQEDKVSHKNAHFQDIDGFCSLHTSEQNVCRAGL